MRAPLTLTETLDIPSSPGQVEGGVWKPSQLSEQSPLSRLAPYLPPAVILITGLIPYKLTHPLSLLSFTVALDRGCTGLGFLMPSGS